MLWILAGAQVGYVENSGWYVVDSDWYVLNCLSCTLLLMMATCLSCLSIQARDKEESTSDNVRGTSDNMICTYSCSYKNTQLQKRASSNNHLDSNLYARAKASYVADSD